MAAHTPDKDHAKVWRESPIRAQNDVIDVLTTGLEAVTYQLRHTRSTNSDVLAVYRAKMEAFEAAIAILEAAKEE